MVVVKRLEELDGLRGVAALAVVLFHYFYNYNAVYGHSFHVPEWTRFGYYGVHLFFLVSGFVIFWTMSRSKRPVDFIWSRFSRLYPVYWASLAITFVAVTMFGLPGREVGYDDFIANFSMFQNYLNFKHVDGVYWTLTYELAFYFWILVVFVTMQVGKIEKWLIIWIASSFLYAGLGVEVDARVEKFLIFDYIQLFSIGICFFKIWKNDQSKFTYIAFGLSIISLFVQYGYKDALLLGFFCAVFYLAVTSRLTILSQRPFVFLGGISYSLYLIHQNIGYIVIRYAYSRDIHPYVGILCAIAVSFLLATILTYAVEKPCLRYLRKKQWG